VREARHGADALRVADELSGEQPVDARHVCPVDLVVSDLVMPVLGGVALAARLRERWPTLPVLFVSGYTDGEQVGADPAMGDAATRLLDKPFSAEGLCAAVREMLAARVDGLPSGAPAAARESARPGT